MAARIVNQASESVADMLSDALAAHFVGTDEFAAHCSAETPCADAAHFRDALNGDARIAGINRIAKIELPREFGNGTGTGRSTKTGPLASVKQVDLILKLAAERGMTSLTRETVARLTLKAASETITELLAQPKPAKPAKPARTATESVELEAGMYRKAGEIFKVQKAVHGSGRMYAKLLVVTDGSGRFEYAAGAIRKLSAADKMTLEDAKAFGAVYGVCCSCAATLTDEDSIAAGIGPVCATKF